MAPHSSTLAWKIPWMEEPGRLQSMGVLKSRTRLSDFTFTFHFHALEKEMTSHASVLAWRIPGMGEPGGLPSMGSHRVGHDWSDLAAAGSQFTSTRAEPKGKASDGAGRSQCIFLSEVWMWLYIIILEGFGHVCYLYNFFKEKELLPGMMSLVEILLSPGWSSSWN